MALLLAFVNWVFDAEDVDTYRALLAVSFALLFGAGVAVPGRAGTILVAAAGVTLLVFGFVAGGAFLFFEIGAGGLGWGWELVMLVGALALLAYAEPRLEPGPAYLAFFGLASFVATVAATSGAEFVGVPGEGDEPSLVGWPLAIAIGTLGAALWGLRRPRRAL